MSPNDLEYYRLRARRERELAATASNRDAAQVHDTLAAEYEALIARTERDLQLAPERANNRDHLPAAL